MEKITVLLADDHTIFRQGLCSLLKDEKDIQVVGEASTSAEAVAKAKQFNPEIVVMDIMMPDYNGLRATTRILEHNAQTKVIILSMSGDEEFVAQAIAAGVKGYLIKQTAASELISAIREIYHGNAFFSPQISKVLIESRQNGTKKKSITLSLREKEILEFIASGKTSKEIADILCISVRTVNKHRQQMMNKLKIHDIAGLTRYAIKRGMA